MKKILLLLLFAFTTHVCFAYSVKINGVSYGLVYNAESKEGVYAYVQGIDATQDSDIKVPEFVTAEMYDEEAQENITVSFPVTEMHKFLVNGPDNLTSIAIEAPIKVLPSCFKYCQNLKEVELPSTIESIEAYTFENCISLEAINLPASLTTIGESAFEGCTELSNIYLGPASEAPEISLGSSLKYIGARAFARTAIDSLQIPVSVTFIGGAICDGCTELTTVINSSTECSGFKGQPYIQEMILSNQEMRVIPYASFAGCTGLQSVRIHCGSLKEIGIGAFSGCTNLKTFEIESGNLTTIEGRAFEGCSSLEAFKLNVGLTTIGAIAFKDCSSLSSIEIPSTIQTIDDTAFYGCTGLKTVKINTRTCGHWFAGNTSVQKVVLDYNVRTIGSNAFAGCSQLSSVSVGRGVSVIEDEAFFGCSSLQQFDIQDTEITRIEARTFEGCESLVTVNIPTTLVSIGNYAFQNCSNLKTINNFSSSNIESIGRQAFKECYSLEDFEFPNSLQSIGESAFAFCTSLEYLLFPEGLKTIANYSFEYCSSLLGIGFSNSVESIGNYAFQNCGNLIYMFIGNGMQTIGANAFGNCNSLKKIDCYAMVPPEIRYSTFSGVDAKKVALIVPSDSYDLYSKHEIWKEFFIKTSVNGIPEDAGSGIAGGEWYGLNGYRRKAQQPGLNIIRMNDGTTRKVLVK